jgi:hypothetical protein
MRTIVCARTHTLSRDADKDLSCIVFAWLRLSATHAPAIVSWGVTVHLLTAADSSVGALGLAVVEVPETWQLSGYALEPGDQLRLLPTTATDADCESAAEALQLGNSVDQATTATAVTTVLSAEQDAARSAP